MASISVSRFNRDYFLSAVLNLEQQQCGYQQKFCIVKRSHSMCAALRNGGGFGKQMNPKHKPRVPKELETGKVENVETFAIFAQKVAADDTSKWEKLGDVMVESGTNVQEALKERKNTLLAAVKHQYPYLVMLSQGGTLRYGIQLTKKSTTTEDSENAADDGDENDDITVLELSGKPRPDSIPAILRVNDGSSPGKRSRRLAF